MTLQQYQKTKLAIVFLISFVFSQAIYFKNYLLPIALLVVSSLVLLYLRRTVREVIADERDYALGGKAALWAIQVYAWLSVVAMFVFYALRDLNPAYEPIGMTLAFSSCILMLTYAVIFRYLDRVSFTDRRFLYAAFVLALFLGLFVVGARLFSGEDSWTCQDGQWIEHGHPDFPAPAIKCKQ